jgi:hypothetical protein
MTDLIHQPRGQLAPPPNVQQQADDLRRQGFVIESIRFGQCAEPEAHGKSGWCITLHDTHRYWFCWIFDDDMMAGKTAIPVDVEIC